MGCIPHEIHRCDHLRWNRDKDRRETDILQMGGVAGRRWAFTLHGAESEIIELGWPGSSRFFPQCQAIRLIHSVVPHGHVESFKTTACVSVDLMTIKAVSDSGRSWKTEEIMAMKLFDGVV